MNDFEKESKKYLEQIDKNTKLKTKILKNIFSKIENKKIIKKIYLLNIFRFSFLSFILVCWGIFIIDNYYQGEKIQYEKKSTETFSETDSVFQLPQNYKKSKYSQYITDIETKPFLKIQDVIEEIARQNYGATRTVDHNYIEITIPTQYFDTTMQQIYEMNLQKKIVNIQQNSYTQNQNSITNQIQDTSKITDSDNSKPHNENQEEILSDTEKSTIKIVIKKGILISKNSLLIILILSTLIIFVLFICINLIIYKQKRLLYKN